MLITLRLHATEWSAGALSEFEQRRPYVVRTVRDRVRNHDLRTDLWCAPDAHADALDRRRLYRPVRRGDSVSGEGDPPERSSGIEVEAANIMGLAVL